VDFASGEKVFTLVQAVKMINGSVSGIRESRSPFLEEAVRRRKGKHSLSPPRAGATLALKGGCPDGGAGGEGIPTSNKQGFFGIHHDFKAKTGSKEGG